MSVDSAPRKKKKNNQSIRVRMLPRPTKTSTMNDADRCHKKDPID